MFSHPSFARFARSPEVALAISFAGILFAYLAAASTFV
jgi:hypothetical protein